MNINKKTPILPSIPIKNYRDLSMTHDGYWKILREQRGLDPVHMETELLLKRIRAGGLSGKILAEAFLSILDTDRPFSQSLNNLQQLDAEAFRLFHGVIHMFHVIDNMPSDTLREIELECFACIDQIQSKEPQYGQSPKRSSVSDSANSDDLKALQHHLQDRSERMEDQVTALKCLSDLLGSQNERGSSLNSGELPYLIDPIVEQLASMQKEFMELFYRADLVFIKPDRNQKSST
jgi:hypothetical protein